ncbi:SDR family oxidoreductase [Nocardia sp. NPDC051030]|uniref:SDR family oxidoreductase n=1 Tax=Nocardia sp. NPDC051030 TaxID=3155162 RepID=UPI00343D565E
MTRVAIIGGHGKIALRLARLLTGEGYEVSSLFRNPDHVDEVAATGATPVVADIENLSTEKIADLITGHDAVVFSAGAGGGNPARTYAVDRDAAERSIDAATAAGVRRFLLVSYFGARTDHGVPPDNSFFHYAEAKAAADAYLRKSSLDWTIVAPSSLTLGPATGLIETAAQGAGSGSVSRDDVASVIAAILDQPATIGRMIQFNSGATPIDQAILA